MISRFTLTGMPRECLGLGCAILVAVTMPAPARAQSSQAPPPSIARRGAVRDVPKEAEVRKAVESSAGFEKTMGSKARPLGEVRPNTDSNLLDHSLLLFDGEKFTIIPEGSILQFPAALRSHLIDKPAGDFMLWPAFLKKNGAWLAAKEVSFKMSRGDVASAKGVLREVATDPRVVVSVYHGGPIMIMEPAPDDPGTTKASDKSSTQRKQK